MGFHRAAEGCHSSFPGLQKVKSGSTRAFLTTAEEVEVEVSSFFAAVFNDNHRCRYRQILGSFPSLSLEQCDKVLLSLLGLDGLCSILPLCWPLSHNSL